MAIKDLLDMKLGLDVEYGLVPSAELIPDICNNNTHNLRRSALSEPVSIIPENSHISGSDTFYLKGLEQRNENEPEIKKEIKVAKGLPRQIVDMELRVQRIYFSTPCCRYAIWNYSKFYYVAMPCKKWTCKYCNKYKYKEIRKRMNDSIAVMWPTKNHIILDIGDPNDNDIMMPAWNDFVTFLRRGGFFTYTAMSGNTWDEILIPKPDLQYIWAIEVQTGRYESHNVIAWHLHVLTNTTWGEGEKYKLIAVWNHCLGLHRSTSKFNYVETRHHEFSWAGEYLFKYFTKEENQILLEKGSLTYKKKPRWGCSQIWDPDILNEDGSILEKGRRHNIVPNAPKSDSKEENIIWMFMKLEDARLCLELYKLKPDAFPEAADFYKFVRKPRAAKPGRSKLMKGNSTLADAMALSVMTGATVDLETFDDISFENIR